MKVFLDTNVVIDFLVERPSFYQDAACIFELWRKKRISLSASVLTMVNCSYILRKAYSKDVMLDKVKWLSSVLCLTSIEKETILNALQHEGSDFEDSVQYFSALPYQPDVILTRDKNGFSGSEIPVMTPAEFLERSKMS